MFSRFTRGKKDAENNKAAEVSDSELSSEEDEDLGGGAASKSKKGSSRKERGDSKTRKGDRRKSSSARSKSKDNNAAPSENDDDRGDSSKEGSDLANSNKKERGAGDLSDSDVSDDSELASSKTKKRGRKLSFKSSSTGKSGRDGTSKSLLSSATTKRERAEDLRNKEEEEARRREAASRHLITGKELALRLDKDDLEHRHHALKCEEAQHFVAIPVLDNTPIPVCTDLDNFSANPVYERSGEIDNCRGRVLVPQGGSRNFRARGAMRWREEVYVEDPVAGRFQRVLYELDENGRRVRTKGKRTKDEDISEYSPQRLHSLVDQLEYILEGVFMLGQGLLSGGSLFQLIVILQIGDTETLLSIYGPLCAEVRRMFFFLAVFSFVGVCDKVTAERNHKQHWTERSPTERVEMLGYWIMFFCCLLTTLLTWPLVDEISETSQAYLEDSTYNISSDFEGTVSRWVMIIIFRFGFAAFGWLLVCKDTNRDLLRGRKRFNQLDLYERELEAGREKLNQFTGKQLDAVPIMELEKLQKTLATGLEEVRLQLQIRGNHLNSNASL